MNCRKETVASLALATLLSACAGGGGNQAPPVYVPTPQGNRVEALAMTTPRANAAAIRLRDGRVLICGGTGTGEIGGVLTSAELYDPVARTFTRTGSMTTPRTGQTITLLRDGRVLLTGGDRNAGFRTQLASAEIYDPASGTFKLTGSMSTPREGHTATILRDGRVLIVGGSPNGIQATDSAEIYDPSAGTFSRTGHLHQPRVAHVAVLLGSGKVLIAGGGRGGRPGGYISYDTAELYDPATRKFASISSHMKSDRVGAAAVKLDDGRVLIVGGKSGKVLVGMRTLASMAPLATAEIYDPESGTFLRTDSMSSPHFLATATKLNDGNVLVVGGWLVQGPIVVGMRDAEVYQSETNIFSRVGRTNVPRLTNTATLLSDGEVLIAGGIADKAQVTASVEFYSPRTHQFMMVPETGAGISPAPMEQ
jgi:Galactose oxidase, central domain/Kelch motif